ncbi:V-type ATP synthase subunit I [Desulfuromonas versatilis]|nr:V-type ATPase 116kDa subunit family protein [Desulfuromonas versatilis]
MSKIEIVGPKEILYEVLTTLRALGVLQIEAQVRESLQARGEGLLKTLQIDKQALSERLFLEELQEKIESILSCLPQIPVRESYLNPEAAMEATAELVDRHTAACEETGRAKTAAAKELAELERFRTFLQAIGPLVGQVRADSDLEFIGLEVKDPGAVEQLTILAHRLTRGNYEIQTTSMPEGGLVALLTTSRELAKPLKKALQGERIPEFALPAYLEEVPFNEKAEVVESRRRELLAEQKRLEETLLGFARRWLPLYRSVLDWLRGRLALVRQSASIYQTELCFIVFGWMPTDQVVPTRRHLADTFADQVVVEEKEILEQELEQVPVALKNPPWIAPFELFARLLPLPRYSSYDPTPFLAIFFPLFFGMILGDLGYGALLGLIAAALVFGFRQRPLVGNAGKILGICAAYTCVFGWLYGECFGEFGHHVLGMEPICFDRRTALEPMLYFALSVGVCHVLLGLLLGVISAVRQKKTREAMIKLLSTVAVFCLVLLLATFILPVPVLLRRPLLVTLGIAVPLLLILGGILAPLELLKHVGNIISYARIMAVGLTSVLLAHVANELAGLAGNILVGMLVAVLLHAFNIVLGVFAPTIHSLRLHYVEFFSKFLEHGGRKFEPLEKNHGGGSWKA